MLFLISRMRFISSCIVAAHELMWTKYFVNHPNLWAPKPSTCLFYTYGLSPDAQLLAIAQNFAHSPGAAMTTIWVSEFTFSDALLPLI